MTQLIDKDDFGTYVKWSNNISAADVNFHCKDAQNFDAVPIMPIAVVSGNNLITDIETAIGESPVTRPQLLTFFEDFVKPYLVLCAYKRFLLWAGRNLTQYGLRVNNEDTSTDVTDKARAEMMADALHKANVYLARLTDSLKDADYTFDTIIYSFNNCETTKPRAKTRIKAV